MCQFHVKMLEFVGVKVYGGVHEAHSCRVQYLPDSGEGDWAGWLAGTIASIFHEHCPVCR